MWMAFLCTCQAGTIEVNHLLIELVRKAGWEKSPSALKYTLSQVSAQ